MAEELSEWVHSMYEGARQQARDAFQDNPEAPEVRVKVTATVDDDTRPLCTITFYRSDFPGI